MKDFILWLAFLCVMLIILPIVLTLVWDEDFNEADPGIITLYNHKTDAIEKINLEDYLVGVVSAEMPAVFSEEALKAQCVAARSYALRKINSGAEAHPDADICTDYAHCQAYYDTDQLKKNWGNDYEKNILKIKKSVSETHGEYLSYDGDVAVTVFHSCSNGITEKSSDVWGGDIPYLTNVTSEGDFEREDYCVSNEITADEFVRIISDFSNKKIENVSELMGEIKYTSGNNVDSVVLCDIKFKGTDVRKMFGLRSTAFEIRFNDDKVIFDVYGNGHGVGMSQYGADSMAKKGSSYAQILAHYYPGTNLVNMYK